MALTTCETVVGDTPARPATSRMVAISPSSTRPTEAEAIDCAIGWARPAPSPGLRQVASHLAEVARGGADPGDEEPDNERDGVYLR